MWKGVRSLCLVLCLGVLVSCAKNEVRLEMTRETVIREPGLSSIQVSPNGRVDTRERAQTVEVRAEGDPGLRGTFSAEGLFSDRAMEEVSPGVYVGRFDLPQGSSGGVPIQVQLLHPPSGANVSRSASSNLMAFQSPAPKAEPGCNQTMRSEFDAALSKISLRFKSNKTELEADSVKLIEQSKALFESRPLCKIYVLGHASEEGPEGYNFMLSTFRALEVVRRLEAIGIPAARIERNFLGESQPIAGSSIDETRTQSRRVELRAYYPY